MSSDEAGESRSLLGASAGFHSEGTQQGCSEAPLASRCALICRSAGSSCCDDDRPFHSAKYATAESTTVKIRDEQESGKDNA